MRRVSAYLSWYANWWSSRAGIGYIKQYDPFLAEGMAAYAERQAHLRTSLQGLFLDHWKDVEAWVKGKKVLDDGHASGAEDYSDDNDSS